MRANIITLLFAFFMPFVAMATEPQATQNDRVEPIPTLVYHDQIKPLRDDTPCATGRFQDALRITATSDLENGGEIEIKNWIRATFAHKQTLSEVLKCPEIQNRDDNDTIRFSPIKYTFPGGREIVINYETQPKVFRQRIALAERRELPPAQMTADIQNDGNEWTNTYPAWYGIMITKHGVLERLGIVGPDKNNTISLDYIRDNINILHPNRYECVGETALAGDFSLERDPLLSLTIREHVSSLENDENDYYVAANNDLRWIGWAEVALDIGLMILTGGANLMTKGGMSAIRATKVAGKLRTAIKALNESADVAKYINRTADLEKAQDALKGIDKTTDAAKHAEKTKEIEQLTDEIKTLEKTNDVKKYKLYNSKLKDMEKIADANRTIRTLGRVENTGNAISKTWKSAKNLRAAYRTLKNSNKTIKSAARVARSSTKSGRLRDWLFQTSMQKAGALAKMAGQTTIFFESLELVGDFWDMTHASTGDFTNGIEFNPMLLLGADDIPGQEDVVNYGMWLMWQGSSTSPSDDDAAYLQAMDYAAKVHLALMNVQGGGNYPCDVDIWVVRPIIQNPESSNPELYYLIMNDTPWTTGQI